MQVSIERPCPILPVLLLGPSVSHVMLPIVVYLKSLLLSLHAADAVPWTFSSLIFNGHTPTAAAVPPVAKARYAHHSKVMVVLALGGERPGHQTLHQHTSVDARASQLLLSSPHTRTTQDNQGRPGRSSKTESGPAEMRRRWLKNTPFSYAPWPQKPPSTSASIPDRHARPPHHPNDHCVPCLTSPDRWEQTRPPTATSPL
jgi:creatinine amidohydrolase/Fe(II)-dependent formamide hydrolase-like protein